MKNTYMEQIYFTDLSIHKYILFWAKKRIVFLHNNKHNLQIVRSHRVGAPKIRILIDKFIFLDSKFVSSPLISLYYWFNGLLPLICQIVKVDAKVCAKISGTKKLFEELFN